MADGEYYLLCQEGVYNQLRQLEFNGQFKAAAQILENLVTPSLRFKWNQLRNSNQIVKAARAQRDRNLEAIFQPQARGTAQQPERQQHLTANAVNLHTGGGPSTTVALTTEVAQQLNKAISNQRSRDHKRLERSQLGANRPRDSERERRRLSLLERAAQETNDPAVLEQVETLKVQLLSNGVGGLNVEEPDYDPEDQDQIPHTPGSSDPADDEEVLKSPAAQQPMDTSK